MEEAASKQASAGVMIAAQHALAWLVLGNAVGLWLALSLAWPGMQAGEWTYGRWVPVWQNDRRTWWTARFYGRRAPKHSTCGWPA